MWKPILLDDWLSPELRSKRVARRMEISDTKQIRELVGDSYRDVATQGGYLVLTSGFVRGVPVKERININAMWYRYFVEEELNLKDQPS